MLTSYEQNTVNII